jgi:hypothetical protein
VLAGRVSYTVETYVLGARVWVDVEVYGIVMRSVNVCTLAGGFCISGLATNSRFEVMLTWLDLCLD